MPLLATEALNLGHGDALYADPRQRLSHVVQLERFDDCSDQFHGYPLAFANLKQTGI